MASPRDGWVLITGCSEGGMGDALAQAFHSQGLNVIATARNTSKISARLSALPRVHVVGLDVNSAPSVASAVKETEALTGGRLEYLVNNSGISYYAPILDVDVDTMRAVFETNVISWVRVVQAFFPFLRAAKGKVINVASAAGIDAVYVPWSAVYNCSKSAASKLSQTMRLELAPFDVKVITLYPGSVQSNICSNMKAAHWNQLLPDSLYQPIAKEVTHILSGAFANNAPADKWAAETVAKVTAARSSIDVWNGNLADVFYWINALAPKWLTDYAYNDQCGLTKLKPRLQEGEKSK